MHVCCSSTTTSLREFHRPLHLTGYEPGSLHAQLKHLATRKIFTSFGIKLGSTSEQPTNFPEVEQSTADISDQEAGWNQLQGSGIRRRPCSPTEDVLRNYHWHRDGTSWTHLSSSRPEAEIPAKNASAEWLSWSQRRDIATSTILLTTLWNTICNRSIWISMSRISYGEDHR